LSSGTGLALAVEPFQRSAYDEIVATARKHQQAKEKQSSSLDIRLWHFYDHYFAIPHSIPGKFTFAFSCEQCSNAIPVEPEEIVRNVSSIEEAFKIFNELATTLEPRIVKCPCGREEEYNHTNVIFVPHDYQAPPFPRSPSSNRSKAALVFWWVWELLPFLTLHRIMSRFVAICKRLGLLTRI
jgi:hypothetical protein